MIVMQCTSFLDPFYAVNSFVLRFTEGLPCWTMDFGTILILTSPIWISILILNWGFRS